MGSVAGPRWGSAPGPRYRTLQCACHVLCCRLTLFLSDADDRDLPPPLLGTGPVLTTCPFVCEHADSNSYGADFREIWGTYMDWTGKDLVKFCKVMVRVRVSAPATRR